MRQRIRPLLLFKRRNAAMQRVGRNTFALANKLMDDTFAAVADFIALFTSGSATPVRGIGTYTYSRDVASETITDFEGLVKTTKVDEIGFDGQRREHNLIADSNAIYPCSEEFNNADSWTLTGTSISQVKYGSPVPSNQYNTVTFSTNAGDIIGIDGTIPMSPAGRTFVASCWMKSDASKSVRMQMYAGANFYGAVTLTNTWKRYFFIATPSSGTYIGCGIRNDAVGVAGSFDIAGYMLAEITGQIDVTDAPGEYISVGTGTESELLSNTGFDTDITGWADGGNGSTPEWDAGRMKVNFPNPTAWACAVQAFTTVVGRRYVMSVDYVAGSGIGARGITKSDHPFSHINHEIDNGAVGDRLSINFVATSTTTYVWLGATQNTAVSGAYATYDNVTCKAIEFGCNIDGVKYFPYRNGNTVAGNIVTVEDQGDLIDTTTPINLGVNTWESRTNYCPYSEDITNTGAYWAKFNLTITDNNVAAPSGETTAEKLTCDSGSGSKVIQQSNLALSPQQALTASVYVKAGNINAVGLTMSSNSATEELGWSFTLSGAGTTGEGFGRAVAHDADDYGIERIGTTDWYRVWITHTFASGTTTDMGIWPLDADTSTESWTADGDEYIYAWGAQLEVGAFVTPYIPNLATGTTTRHADNLEYDVDNYDETLDSVTITGEFSVPRDGDVSGEAQTVFSFDDTASNEVMRLLITGTGVLQAISVDSASVLYIASTAAAHVQADTVYKFAIRFSRLEDGSKFYLDGVYVPHGAFNDARATLTFDKFYVGDVELAANPLNGNVRNLKIYNSEITDAQLEALST